MKNADFIHSTVSRTIALATGPVMTVALVPGFAARFGNPGETPLFMVVALAAWSPLFFSIPSLVLADARDQALPGFRGMFGALNRGLRLIPNLLSPGSPVRVEMAASLAGFFLALVVALPVLQQLPQLI